MLWRGCTSNRGIHSPMHFGKAGALGIPAAKHQLLILPAIRGQLSRRFQALTGDKQQITAESSQERPQVGKCCCSQGGKSWIREGVALPRPCAPAQCGTPHSFRESRHCSFARGRFLPFRPFCSSLFQRSASLFLLGCSLPAR